MKRTNILQRLRNGRPVFMVTGTWSGYNSSQTRVCHVHYIYYSETADKINALSRITFTDGTDLLLSAKQIFNKAELLEENENYRDLIEKCLQYNVNSVAELHSLKK